jgi:transcriptional regulator with XRE-family HTH domain
MSNIAVQVGGRIRQIREQKNISLLSFSYLCDIEYSHLSKIEKGKINTSLCHLVKISNALDVCLVCLFTNDDIDVVALMSEELINQKVFSTVHRLEQCNK